MKPQGTVDDGGFGNVAHEYRSEFLVEFAHQPP